MPIRPRSGSTHVVRQRKSCSSSFGAGLFEAENLAALRIDPGHDVPDGAVLAGRVHPLKNQQQRIAVGGVVKVLQRAQLLNVLFQEFLILLLRLAKGLHDRRPLAEFDLFSGGTRKSFESIFIFIPSSRAIARALRDFGFRRPSNLALRLKPVLFLLASRPGLAARRFHRPARRSAV